MFAFTKITSTPARNKGPFLRPPTSTRIRYNIWIIVQVICCYLSDLSRLRFKFYNGSRKKLNVSISDMFRFIFVVLFLIKLSAKSIVSAPKYSKKVY